MNLVLIYVTHKDIHEAKTIASSLIEQKLIACANFFPIESMYRWEGKVENSKEVVALLKTTTEHWARVQKEIKKMHSYDVPCIMKIDAEAHEGYIKWIESETL